MFRWKFTQEHVIIIMEHLETMYAFRQSLSASHYSPLAPILFATVFRFHHFPLLSKSHFTESNNPLSGLHILFEPFSFAKSTSRTSRTLSLIIWFSPWFLLETPEFIRDTFISVNPESFNKLPESSPLHSCIHQSGDWPMDHQLSV